MLIVTNGDSAVAALTEAGVPGHIFPWRDVLHEGPVTGESLEAVSDVRAEFISGRGWGTAQGVRNDFRLRDKKLESARHHDELVVWLEHDLYDQLQLFQILDWLDRNPPEDTRVSLICHESFVTHNGADQLVEWFGNRAALTAAQLSLGRRAWSAFTAPTPEPWSTLHEEDTDHLQFVAGALERLLQELPGPLDGLSRTERQILQALDQGHHTPGALFRANNQMEEAAFMGDASFWAIMEGLSLGQAPLLAAKGTFRSPGGPRPDPAFLGQSLNLTTAGRDVLTGTVDWLSLRPIDKWLGGVHLGPSVWRWDPGQHQLLSP